MFRILYGLYFGTVGQPKLNNLTLKHYIVTSLYDIYNIHVDLDLFAKL